MARGSSQNFGKRSGRIHPLILASVRIPR
jgi:hypothetical protein